MSTLESQYRLCDIIRTIVGITQIIIDIRRNTIFQEILIILDSLLIIPLLILSICILLGYCRSRYRCKEKECKNPYERIGLSVLFCTVLVLLAHSIDCVFYFHNSCHSRIESLVHITSSITWCISLELALIQCLGKFINR